LGYHIVDSETEKGNSFFGLFENSFFLFEIMIEAFVFFFVGSNFFHKSILSVDQLNSFFQTGIIVSIDFLSEHDFDETSESFGFGFVVRSRANFVNSLKST